MRERDPGMTEVTEGLEKGAGWASGIGMNLILPPTRGQPLGDSEGRLGRAYWILDELV